MITLSLESLTYTILDPQAEKEPSGCTAVATLVDDDGNIFCANAGDSRAVLSDGGLAEPLSFDHKPGNPSTPFSLYLTNL